MFVKPSSAAAKEHELLETTLRPKTWNEYIGQEKLKASLEVMIKAAKKRGEPLDHLLFYGNPGLGKTTLAHVVAHEFGTEIKTCSGLVLEKTGDVASLLTNLREGEILFIDECHRMAKPVMEMLYSAMEDSKLYILLGRGPMARTMELTLPHFTLIGATTRPASLPSPLRNRFGALFQLVFYELKDIKEIVRRSARILQTNLEPQALEMISARSRFTPRVANRILKRVRDVATIEGSNLIDEHTAKRAVGLLEIDELGLEAGDRKILEALIYKFAGGPAGIQALAALTAEDQDTILDIYEPYLLQLGFIERTAKGRIATRRAYEHLKISVSSKGLL